MRVRGRRRGAGHRRGCDHRLGGVLAAQHTRVFSNLLRTYLHLLTCLLPLQDQQNGLAIKKGATSKIRTGDRQARGAEVTPLGLRQTVVKEATAALFNRGKAGKLIPT
jgi:hypothetical protein